MAFLELTETLDHGLCTHFMLGFGRIAFAKNKAMTAAEGAPIGDVNHSGRPLAEWFIFGFHFCNDLNLFCLIRW
jgi:hypothetical protein